MTRTLSPALVFVLGVLGMLGCTRPAPPVVAAKPPEVVVDRPVRREVTDYEDFTGRTEAVKSIDVRARVTGFLRKVSFKDGADVKAGDPLFEIDPDWFQAELDKAKASVLQAVAFHEQSQAEIARVSNEFTRVMSLTSSSQDEKDRVTADKLKAEAVLRGAAAAILVAKATEKLAQQNRDWAVIVAPIEGRVSRHAIDVGNLVKADDTILTSLVALDQVYVYFDVDDRTLLRVRRLIRDGKIESARGRDDTQVQVGLADEPGFSLTGTVDFIDNKVDPSTGTLRLRAVLDNPEKNRNRLLSPGMFVRVRLPIGRPRQVVLVPEEALGTDQGQKFVYVVNEKDEVVYRPVKLGAQHDQFRVVESGVLETERVIVSGLQRVRPGAKVTPRSGQSTPGSGPKDSGSGSVVTGTGTKEPGSSGK